MLPTALCFVCFGTGFHELRSSVAFVCSLMARMYADPEVGPPVGAYKTRAKYLDQVVVETTFG